MALTNDRHVGMKVIKFMLLSVTAIFMIVSALIISVGTTILAIYQDVSFFLDGNLYSPAAMLIVIGVIMLFVSLFGCIGALKESTCLVNMFGVFLIMVLLLEISAAIATYVYRAQVPDVIYAKLRDTIPDYYKDDEVMDAFDFAQSRLHCCGVESYEDWSLVEAPAGSGIVVNTTLTVPNSCCAETRFETQENNDVPTCTSIYSNGCLPSLIYLIFQSAGLLGVGALTIAFVQLIGICFSFSLAKSIRRAKSERQRRQWEIREQMLNAYTSLKPDEEKKAPIVYVPFQGQTVA